MDTVHSSRESNKTLLTFFFTKEKLFLAFLLNRCTKGAVRLIFDRLEKRMGTYEFLSVFEYILTDRGSELEILSLLKQDWMKFSVPASTIVIPCVADKKEVLSRLTPCFAWCFPKELVLNF